LLESPALSGKAILLWFNVPPFRVPGDLLSSLRANPGSRSETHDAAWSAGWSGAGNRGYLGCEGYRRPVLL